MSYIDWAIITEKKMWPFITVFIKIVTFHKNILFLVDFGYKDIFLLKKLRKSDMIK